VNQKVYQFKEPFPHLIVENMYTDEELALIWQELEFLTYFQKLSDPEEYKGAKNSLGEYLTVAKALELDTVYNNRNFSNILTVNRKLFSDGYTNLFSELAEHLKFVPFVNLDHTKIRYYENGEFYDAHVDCEYLCIALSYFYKSPKMFSGGELFFPDYDFEFSCDHNSMIMIPGYIKHGVKQITTQEKPFSGNSRYCMTQFLHYKSNDGM